MSAEQSLRVKKRKEFIGTVISNRMQKTIVVQVQRLSQHPRYVKTFKKKQNFKVHDEKNEAHIGDKVLIEETRPLSKDKRWRLVEIISKAKKVEDVNDL